VPGDILTSMVVWLQGDDHGLSLAADGLSLRLPSGRTLGHKSLNIYYKQHLRPDDSSLPDSTSTALTTKLRSVRAKLADPSLSLVPVGGGSGAFGKGQMVMKARNAGEAKWAKKLGSTHLDQRMKEGPRHLVSMRGGNNQKHYRDMLCKSRFAFPNITMRTQLILFYNS
jgi:pre-60S factor REI1